jgi:hypothetical protein
MTSATFDTTTADVLAHAPVGVLLLDERGVVVRANDAAARLLRSTVERLAGEHVLDVARPLDGSLLKRLGINLGRHRAAAMARLAEGPVMVHARGVRGGAELTVTAYGPDAEIRHVAWLREQAPAPAAEPPRGASVDQLASFADADATVVCSVDADGMLTAVSGAALTAAGVCCEEAVASISAPASRPSPCSRTCCAGPTAASPATTRSTSAGDDPPHRAPDPRRRLPRLATTSPSSRRPRRASGCSSTTTP